MSIEDKMDRCLESIHRIEISLVEIKADLLRNTDDMEEHIKRTNLLEKKVTKVYTFALMALGFVAAKYGTEILKILGVVL